MNLNGSGLGESIPGQIAPPPKPRIIPAESGKLFLNELPVEFGKSD